jgi:hypothetical protein
MDGGSRPVPTKMLALNYLKTKKAEHGGTHL